MSLVQTTGDQIVEFLVAQNVDTVFCITGAGNLAIVDAFSRYSVFMSKICSGKLFPPIHCLKVVSLGELGLRQSGPQAQFDS
jgi:hypothetical protein